MSQARIFMAKKNDVVYDGEILSSIAEFQELLREATEYFYVIGKIPEELEIYIFSDGSAIARMGTRIGFIKYGADLLRIAVWNVGVTGDAIKSYLLAEDEIEWL